MKQQFTKAPILGLFAFTTLPTIADIQEKLSIQDCAA